MVDCKYVNASKHQNQSNLVLISTSPHLLITPFHFHLLKCEEHCSEGHVTHGLSPTVLIPQLCNVHPQPRTHQHGPEARGGALGTHHEDVTPRGVPRVLPHGQQLRRKAHLARERRGALHLPAWERRRGRPGEGTMTNNTTRRGGFWRNETQAFRGPRSGSKSMPMPVAFLSCSFIQLGWNSHPNQQLWD